MNTLGRTEVRSFVRDLLDRLDTSGRFAFLKLATGALRIGVVGAACQAGFGGVERQGRDRDRNAVARAAAAL